MHVTCLVFALESHTRRALAPEMVAHALHGRFSRVRLTYYRVRIGRFKDFEDPSDLG